MTDEKQEQDVKSQVEEREVPQDIAQKTDVSQDKPRNLRETILAAKREAEENIDKAAVKAEKQEKPVDKAEPVQPDKDVKEPEKKAASSEADKRREEDEKSKISDQKKEEEKEQPSSKPPASWSKSSRAEWDSLSPSIQAEVLRREADTARGVEELKKKHNDEATMWKSRHADLDDAMRPYEEAIQQSGRTKGQIVKNLLDWNAALVGPNRVDAFRALAMTFGVDTAQLSGVTSAQSPQDAAAIDSQVAVPQQVVDRSWEPAIRNVAQRLEHYEQQNAAQRQATAEQVVNNWAKDKGHFEKVRGLMAQLIDNDAKMGGVRFLRNGQIDMDAAYEAAIWADPETRADLLAEQRVQHEAAAKAAADKARADADARILAEKQRADAEKARRAAVSLRPGAPLSGVNGGAPNAIPSRESVRDSIKRALSGM